MIFLCFLFSNVQITSGHNDVLPPVLCLRKGNTVDEVKPLYGLNKKNKKNKQGQCPNCYGINTFYNQKHRQMYITDKCVNTAAILN